MKQILSLNPTIVKKGDRQLSVIISCPLIFTIESFSFREQASLGSRRLTFLRSTYRSPRADRLICISLIIVNYLCATGSSRAGSTEVCSSCGPARIWIFIRSRAINIADVSREKKLGSRNWSIPRLLYATANRERTLDCICIVVESRNDDG